MLTMVAAMLMFLILACLFFAGWARWPWWTPLATFAVAVPLILMQIGSINLWRGEAGLAADGPPEAWAILIVTLVLYCVAYGLGFGASRLFRDRP
jgi:hypothetical protein